MFLCNFLHDLTDVLGFQCVLHYHGFSCLVVLTGCV